MNNTNNLRSHIAPHEIVEVFKNNDSSVFKFVHYNGTETTIKTNAGCVDDLSRNFSADRNKAVLFVSVSTGCTQKCKFCYLTAKKYPFYNIDTDTIIKSCIEAIKRAKKILKTRYLKISFMGMGDVFYSRTALNDIVKKVFGYAYSKGMIKGIDGVDIGTSYPDSDNSCILKEIEKVKDTVHILGIPFNPFNNYTAVSSKEPMERTIVRLFISLHSMRDATRKFLMPNSASIEDILEDIKDIQIDVAFHYMLFANVNDSAEELKELMDFFSYSPYELRLLRFNQCPNLSLKESALVKTSIDLLKNLPIKFKYQISAGQRFQLHAVNFFAKKVENKLDRPELLC